MYLQQLVKEGLGYASYLVGDTDAAICAIVNPRLDMIDDLDDVLHELAILFEIDRR